MLQRFEFQSHMKLHFVVKFMEVPVLTTWLSPAIGCEVLYHIAIRKFVLGLKTMCTIMQGNSCFGVCDFIAFVSAVPLRFNFVICLLHDAHKLCSVEIRNIVQASSEQCALSHCLHSELDER